MSENPADIVKRILEIQGRPMDDETYRKMKDWMDRPTRQVVQYDEPMYYHDEDKPPDRVASYVNRTVRLEVEDAVTLARAHHKFESKRAGIDFAERTREEYLQEFLTIHWAKLVEA